MNLTERFEIIKEEAIKKLVDVTTSNQLNDVKSYYLGKKGELSLMLSTMKDLSPEERPKFGQVVNEAKQELSVLFQQKSDQLEQALIEEKLAIESEDVTLPGRFFPIGSRNLLRRIVEELEDLFVGMGYTVKEGPEVEQDLYNFEMLNLPKTHPARDMQDSFYITEETLLRTHTSPVQVRTLLENTNQEPVKIICPGKVYRRDDDDQTHSHQFMQVEVLVVDEKASFADLKGTLLIMAKKLFGEERQIRLRPSYFPFTEPSVEVDVSCYKCGGVGCSMCKQTGWIEILGAGMVNNNVLQAAGYDPNRFQGFALGVGVERLAILKYGIDDIRNFYVNDMRFNRQFK